jgi:hypothetical protein
MELLSKITFNSQALPGVVVVFRRPTAITRAAFLAGQAKQRIAIREIQRQRKPLDLQYDEALAKAKAAAKVEVDALITSEGISRQQAEERIVDFTGMYLQFRADNPEWADLADAQMRLQHDGEGWARLRAMLISVDGLVIDGEPVTTADQVIEQAPPALTDELIEASEQIAGLSPTERGESPWLGTSPKADPKPPNDTIAIPADSEQVAE